MPNKRHYVSFDDATIEAAKKNVGTGMSLKGLGSRNVLVSFLNLLLLKSYKRTSPSTSFQSPLRKRSHCSVLKIKCYS